MQVKHEIKGIKWRFQAFKDVNRRTKFRAISPKLGSTSEDKSFKWLVHCRPQVKSKGSFSQEDVQSFTSGSDALSCESRARLISVRDLVPLLVQAGFPEIEELTDIITE